MSLAIVRSGVIVMACCAGGCTALVNTGAADLAGAGGAALAAAVTSNAAIAAGIGLGVQAGARAGVQYAQREVHDASQDEIARAASSLQMGEVATWRTHHRVPLEIAEHGRVTVSRVIAAGAIDCKELVFSVESERRGEPRLLYYVATICRDGARWKWASAEPSTARWGALQ